jgi:D-glucosaminate-6-phosphate ammonia-lyase
VTPARTPAPRPRPRRVVNGKGPATILGGARVSETVIAAMADAMRRSVHMPELQAAAGSVIARAIGAEAAFVTGCAAAGMSVSVAAAIGGADPAQVTSLPRPSHARTEIVIQKAHVIIVGGCSADQVIRLGGGSPVEVGTAADCADFQLAAGIGPNTAAALFVEGERAHGSGTLGLAEVVRVCHEARVPVIVDAAGTSSPRAFFEAGADLVVFSGHKWFRGPTSGVVAGRRDLVHAAFLHGEFGVGRPMKAGKEGIAGVLAAVEEWADGAAAKRDELERSIAAGVVDGLAGLPGLTPRIVPTEHESTAAVTVRVDVDAAAARVQAWQLAEATEALDPSVVLYDYEAAQGYLLIDPGFLDEGDDRLIVDAVSRVLGQARRQPFDLDAAAPPRFAALVSGAADWLTQR